MSAAYFDIGERPTQPHESRLSQREQDEIHDRHLKDAVCGGYWDEAFKHAIIRDHAAEVMACLFRNNRLDAERAAYKALDWMVSRELEEMS